MEQKPLLLVDIDGVLNCFGDLGTTLTNFEQEFVALNFRIKVPEGTQQRLQTLSESFEMIWATTWEDDAFEHIGKPLGLDKAWPVIHFDQNNVAQTWKLPSIKKWIGNRDCAWIDDDLHKDAFEWEKARNEKGLKTKLVQPTPQTGMTQQHVDDLLFWAKH